MRDVASAQVHDDCDDFQASTQVHSDCDDCLKNGGKYSWLSWLLKQAVTPDMLCNLYFEYKSTLYAWIDKCWKCKDSKYLFWKLSQALMIFRLFLQAHKYPKLATVQISALVYYIASIPYLSYFDFCCKCCFLNNK